MRLIDADALMREFTEFVRASNNSDFAKVPTWNDAVSLLGSAPTVDLLGQTVYGYSIRFLVYVATVMEKKGITAEQAAEIVMDMRAFVQLFYEEQKEITRKAFEEIGKSQKSYVDWELRRE